MSSTNDHFSLKGTDSEEFSVRLNSVFDGISVLEQDHENWRSNQNSVQNERLWKAEPGEEISSALEPTFKRPRGFAIKRRLPSLDYVPNFRRNPSKWTKYSLADVPELSELSNTRAALSFLDDCKRQKLESAKHELGTEKIIFHKPRAVGTENIAATVASGNGSSLKCTNSAPGKFVMPECVVGSKKARSTSRHDVTKASLRTSTSIHLEHLDDDENDTPKDVTGSEKSHDSSSSINFHKFTKRAARQLKEKDGDGTTGDEDPNMDLQ